MFAQDAAAGLLSGDGLLLLADALQPSTEGGSGSEEGSAALESGYVSQDPGAESTMQEAAVVDCVRQQQLLTSLVTACRVEPHVNIMAGTSCWLLSCIK